MFFRYIILGFVVFNFAFCVNAVAEESQLEGSFSDVEKASLVNEESKQVNLDDNRPESEIPVLTKVETKKSESSNPFFRLLLSVGIIAALCVGGIFFSKWWGKTYKPQQDTNRIRVVNQHFLGPKKSLAIVRVAGESILVGITEQSISHIKTLSLLDEESEEVDGHHEAAPKSFKSAMKKRSFKISEPDEFSFGQINDRFTQSSGADKV